MGLMLGHKNHIDGATLSGGTWSTTYPRDNIKSLPVKKFGRITIPANVKTLLFYANLGLGQKSVDLFGLFGCRWPEGTGLLFVAATSAVLTPPYVWQSLQGQYLYITDAKRSSCVVPVPRITATYWAVYAISTVGGDIDIGRAFIGEAFKPEANYDFGNQNGLESATVVQSSLSGVDFYDSRPLKRTKSAKWSWLSQHEAYRGLRAAQRRQDVSGELVVCDDDLINPSYLAGKGAVSTVWALTGATGGTTTTLMETPEGRAVVPYIEVSGGISMHGRGAGINPVTVSGDWTFMACVKRYTHSLFVALRFETGGLTPTATRAVFDYSTGAITSTRAAPGWQIVNTFSRPIVDGWHLIGMVVRPDATITSTTVSAFVNLMESPGGPDEYAPAATGHRLYIMGQSIFEGARTALHPGIEDDETFLARFRQLSAIEYPYVDTHAAAVEFVEVV